MDPDPGSGSGFVWRISRSWIRIHIIIQPDPHHWSRLEGYRKGGIRTGEIRSGRDATLDKRDKGQLGGRTGGMQDWRESEV